MTEPAGLTASVQSVGGSPDVARVYLAGRSDPLGVQRLQHVVDAALEQGKTRLLVDCQRLEYVNSTAIGYLINLADRLAEAQGKLALLHVSPAVQKVFDVLGLKDYFSTFSDEGAAFGHLTKGAPGTKLPGSFVAPTTPLDPLRWILFLRAVAEKVDAAAVPDLCRRLNVAADGGTLQAVRRILGRVRSPEEFLRLLDPRTLAASCALYGLPGEGSPNALVERIVSLVRKSSSAELSKALETPPTEAAAVLPLELTVENLVNLLEHTELPRRGVPAAIAARIAKAFGRDKVKKNRPAGGLGWAGVDFEVDGRFGIVIVASKALLKKGARAGKLIQTFLGRLAVAGRHYGKGNVIAILAGKVSPAQAPVLEELRALTSGLGSRLVALP